jgi:hypothetical protein
VEIAIAAGVAVVAVVLFRRQHNDIHDSSRREMQCMVSLEPKGGFINEGIERRMHSVERVRNGATLGRCQSIELSAEKIHVISLIILLSLIFILSIS